ncbi:Sec-independent protein translocase TatC [Sediminihabitans luteus]|uniref:Sec-independent protein translocase protein TatC n=1 Tax=Sediminihabitans luteus TaxID=1138585 RepID=A0A2M9CQZ6_9CELL|nr:twin-arginine translocase subunit TatC [Sediminihabitans luteus]PJJ74261.1 Sec-independent protein translocase TatC [Sediminihabitans luteus]
MPLRSHLVEARHRVFLAAIGVVVGAVVGWILYEPIFEALQQPLADVSAERGILATLNFSGVVTAVDMKVKVSLFLGVIVSSPWWLYQVWAFITPGLRSAERRYAIVFIGSGVPLFLLGAAAAWLALPRTVGILNEFVPDGSANLVDAGAYLGFVMRFVLAFGLVCLVPLIMVALTFLGVVPGGTWLAGWRWGVLFGFVFAAVMTPTPDVLSMFLVALPVVALYFVAVGVCLLHDRRARRRAPVEHDVPAT